MIDFGKQWPLNITFYCKCSGLLFCILDATEPWFGIIVTYNDLYLGFGFDAWLEFLKNPVEKYCAEKGIDLSLLPPENLFFLDIADWDYLVQVIKDKNASLDEIYKKAKETTLDSDILSRKFSFDMVLKDYFPIKRMDLSYLSAYSPPYSKDYVYTVV